ncbi:DUF3040 domain-containing protein [Amycolatopsis alkalitolerans]|uniref:DUF3040 domain-containing protein n=1 Tax=Amycolatopsis alkalitolerans TaxID=2547244 RepID=A0A5C4M4J4_9PSEU|nr:DUF3040 domain-containing protein [Amycolatopsis alkalitolerans]TNC28036.1 DUF3040 domain-containing protein [Amycolatopsis alkalitolerans]
MESPEARRLAEIQHHLTNDDPALARLLATGRATASGGFVAVLGGMLASFAAGLLLLLLGAQLRSSTLLAVGVLLVVVIPAVLIVWRFRWRHKP